MDILTTDFSVRGIELSSKGRINWPEDYETYAAQFGTQPRTIRAWVADGKKKSVPGPDGSRILQVPPLFDPHGMVKWWKSHKTQKVPAGLLAAARSVPGPETLELETPPVTEKKSKDENESAREARGDDGLIDGGADESLRQAREFVQDAYKKRKLAIDHDDPAAAEEWGKEWTKAVETQRKWEQAITVINERRGLLLRREKVEAEVLAVASALSRGFLASLKKVLQENCPHLSQREIRQKAIAERDSLFDVFRASDFALLNYENVSYCHE